MKSWLRWSVSFALLLLVTAGMALSVLNSQWFRRYVLGRLVATIEETSGGRTEIGDYSFDWKHLRAEIHPFVLHGTEAEGKAPLFRTGRLEVGFKVLSWFNRDIDLREFIALKPELHVYVDEQGRTNLPTPRKAASARNPLEQVFKLAIDRVELRDGVVEFDSRRIPLSLYARDLQIAMDFEAIGPQYRGRLSSSAITYNGNRTARLNTGFLLATNRVALEGARVESNNSTIDLDASIKDFYRPVVDATYQVSLNAASWPLSPLTSGRIQAKGKAHFTSTTDYWTEGRVDGSALALTSTDFRLSGAQLRSNYRISPDQVRLTQTHIDAARGTFDGSASIEGYKRLVVEGNANGFDLNTLVAAANSASLPWNGLLSGPVKFSADASAQGLRNTVFETSVAIVPAPGQLPVEGQFDLAYRQSEGKIRISASTIKTADSRVHLKGTLGEHLEVGIWSTNIQDLEPVIRILFEEKSFTLPATLQDGEARWTGSVDGQLDDPQISGHLVARNIVYEGRRIDRFESDVRASKDQLALTNATFARSATRLSGAMRLGLDNWKFSSTRPLSGFAAARGVDVAAFVAENKIDLPAAGTLSVTLRVEGAYDAPKTEFRFQLDQAVLAGEQFRRVTGRLEYQGGEKDALQGSVTLDEARFSVAGDYQRTQPGWDNGTLTLRTKLEQFALGASEAVQAAAPGLTGGLSAEFRLRVTVTRGLARLQFLEGQAGVDRLALRNESLGDFILKASTQNNQVLFTTSTTVRNTRFSGEGTVDLKDGYPLVANVSVPRLPFRLISDLAGKDFGEQGSPLRGFLQGSIRAAGPLADWKKLTAEVTIDQMRLRPRSTQVLDTQIDTDDLTLRNDGPLRIALDSKAIRITQARFAAKETSLSLEGAYTLGAKTPFDFRVNGGINLAVLSTFRADLQAAGASTLSATLRGTPDAPELSGRMEVKEASFFLKDLPNGVEQANAVILFDRSRATIEKLTGQTGGGAFEMSGFVSFAQQDIVFRLQTALKQVRIRYPAGVSTLLDADLNLTGSYARSLLTGLVSISRVSFVPQSDMGNMLADPVKSAPSAVTRNEFLQGLQFDVRIRNTPNAIFQSSFSREVQAEADLRLRGSAIKPIVLGSLKANQGEIELFGTRYTVSRGEVLFYNTAIIQPTLDFDVETRARGVTVYINVAGPVDKLNINYRSEPPLQTNEIIALLTVGRTPGSLTSGIPATPTFQRSNVLENSPNTLLGGALSSALTSRAEKFFGASRIKLDPQVTGLEGVSQSRLTVEQSISRDVTVTFSTNLARTQQQIISAEWDFSRDWAAVVTRDENGAFSMEVRLRKRFK